MADNPVLELLLRRLEVADGGLDSAELATQLGVEHQAVVGAVKSLQALGEVSPARAAARPRFHTGSPIIFGEGTFGAGALVGSLEQFTFLKRLMSVKAENAAHVGA